MDPDRTLSARPCAFQFETGGDAPPNAAALRPRLADGTTLPTDGAAAAVR